MGWIFAGLVIVVGIHVSRRLSKARDRMDEWDQMLFGYNDSSQDLQEGYQTTVANVFRTVERSIAGPIMEPYEPEEA